MTIALTGIVASSLLPQAVAQKIYWTDSLNGKIQRADLDGSNVEDLVTGLTPFGIALDLVAGKMYWSAFVSPEAGGDHRIQRANLDGSNIEDVVMTAVDDVVWIALDVAAGKLYWADIARGMIRRAGLEMPPGENARNRTDITNLVPGARPNLHGFALDIDGGKMYWTRIEAQKIQRANLDGSDVEDLVTTGTPHYRDITVDSSGGKMYWADSTLGAPKVQRANTDGSNIENLVTVGQDGPFGIALDLSEGKMYWTDILCCLAHQGSINRADLDGSNIEVLIPVGTIFPIRLALDLRGADAGGNPVPAVGHWGLIILSLLLLSAAGILINSRRAVVR